MSEEPTDLEEQIYLRCERAIALGWKLEADHDTTPGRPISYFLSPAGEFKGAYKLGSGRYPPEEIMAQLDELGIPA